MLQPTDPESMIGKTIRGLAAVRDDFNSSVVVVSTDDYCCFLCLDGGYYACPPQGLVERFEKVLERIEAEEKARG
jgi:hypothetical protein